MANFDRILDVERTEMATFDPDATWNGLTPAGNARQTRNDSAKFTFSDTSLIYDWYEAHLMVDAAMLKLGGGAAGGMKMGIIPGNFSIVEQLVVKSGGADLYRISGANPVLFIRKTLETGLGYSETVGTNEGFILDSNKKTSVIADNPGLKKRTFTGVKKLKIPLKNWGFFKALKDKLLPAIHLSIEVKFDEDMNILFGPKEDDGTSNKLIIQKVVLRVPNVFLKAGRQKEITNELMGKRPDGSNRESPMTIKYVQEQLSIFPQQKTLGASINMSEGIIRPLNIFVFATPSAAATETTRKYDFITFNNGVNVEKLVVRHGGNTWYPDPTGYTSDDMERMFFDAISYANRQDDPSSSGVCFNYDEWKKDYGFTHFEMRKATPLSTADAKTITVVTKFSGTVTADYNLNVGIIYFVEAVIKHEGGRIIIVKLP